MLIKDIESERSVASMAKNSSFYIEVAKFVQAYSVIINNPNEFLQEVGLPLIDEKKEILNWNQFVKIMENCDFGFKTKPTQTDLIVFYNYAIQIGTIGQTEKRIASVDDVADAQKHYYNFVDEVADRAQTEYMKQHEVTEARQREAKLASDSLTKLEAVKIVSCFFMALGVFLCSFGIASLFLDNNIAGFLGGIIPIWQRQYVGAILMIILGFVIFAIFDGLYLKYKRRHLKLKRATKYIFERSDETFLSEIVLKRKYETLKKDLQTVQAELNDKDKRFDVKQNIEKLKALNKYYQKFCEKEDELSVSSTASKSNQNKNSLSDEDFAPVKLSKEQEENLHSVSKDEIILEGHFDDEAYNEKFEKSTRKNKFNEDESGNIENEELEEEQEKEDKKEQKQKEQEREKQKIEQQVQENEIQKEQPATTDQELLDSIDYIKSILGFGSTQSEENEMDKQ